MENKVRVGQIGLVDVLQVDLAAPVREQVNDEIIVMLLQVQIVY